MLLLCILIAADSDGKDKHFDKIAHFLEPKQEQEQE